MAGGLVKYNKLEISTKSEDTNFLDTPVGLSPHGSKVTVEMLCNSISNIAKHCRKQFGTNEGEVIGAAIQKFQKDLIDPDGQDPIPSFEYLKKKP